MYRSISAVEDRFHFKGNKIEAIFELNGLYSNWIVGIQISHLIFHSLLRGNLLNWTLIFN